ncbi:MAG TPA: APC family permease [Solirubrobacterales bacterium]|nr:APC family permease [Solirubrobacterales bacterium]
MARRIPRDESLSRVHGVGALFAAAYGNVGSSIYYALGVTAAFALGLTPLAFVIAGLIFICTAATYAEATVMYPEAGGSSSFARHAFNEFVSFVAAWGQLLNYVITAAISAYFVPHYLGVFWSPLEDAPFDIGLAALLVVGLALINIRGTEESAKLNIVLASADLATQAALVVLGLGLVFSPEILVDNVHFGVAPTWSDFALGIAVGMIAYTGIETISNMSEEAREAARTIPRAVGLTVVAVLGLYMLIPLVALSAMPVTQGAGGEYTTALGTTFADNPMLGIVENLGLGAAATEILRYYVGLFAGVILLIATNAAMIAVSRLTYSMGQYRQLPEALRQVHPRYRTPYIAIILFAVIAIVTMLPGQTDFLATMYSFGAMLSFTIAHVAVIQLRRTKRDAERPWKPPLNLRAFGVEVPLSAVLGGLGTFAAWLVVMALNPTTLMAGLGWMAFGIAVYLLYRRHQRLPLTETVKVVLPEPLGVEEVEYRSVLVAFEDDEEFSPEMVATAVKLASKRRRGIHVHSMMTVPTNLPLDAELSEKEAEAQRKIEEAKLIGGQRVTGHVARVRPGQAGYSVSGEAAEIRAAAIVVGLRYRNGVPLYDKTLQTILGERPCRVIVVSDPTDKPPAVPGAALAEATPR